MLIALWIINALLALAFVAAGSMKLFTSKVALAEKGMAWTDDFAATQVKLIGAAEVVGALGLILPLATGMVPLLSPIAAFALAALMLGAVLVHARRKEPFMPSLVLATFSLVSALLGVMVLAG